MLIHEVIVEFCGADARIPQVAALFGSERYGKVHQFQDESGDQCSYAAIRLEGIDTDAELALETVLHWIESNTTLLQEFHCDKVLEIQSYMLPEEGSRSLCFDTTLVDALSQAGLRLRQQVMQVVADRTRPIRQNEPPLPVPRCNLIVLRAADLDAVESFYRVLGLEFVRHAHGAGPTHLASENTGVVFEIYPLADRDPPTSSTRIGFVVASVDETYALLLTAGGQSKSSPQDSPWGRRAVVTDPAGHRVELTA